MVKKGLLLINLGTPRAPSFLYVWQYLTRFLSDPRVIDLPALMRYVLLLISLPVYARRSLVAYQRIWTAQGSPLQLHCQVLAAKLQETLQESHIVRLGMRYGEPSIESALRELAACHHLTILPLYPQYASASSGSSLAAVLRYLSQQPFIPSLRVIHAFYDQPDFIRAQAHLIRPLVAHHEFVLFSYHGLPERQLAHMGCIHPCEPGCTPTAHSSCYRQQCYTTSDRLAQALSLSVNQFETVFQSRFGRTPWIQPDLFEYLDHLAKQNVKYLLVACPSFTADCLETLDEIGNTARKRWLALGGTHFTFIPALNATPVWCDAIVKMINYNPT